MRRFLPLLFFSLALAGCKTVGPDYRGPVPGPVSEALKRDWAEPGPVGPIRADWWNGFGDPVLARLVAEARANAPDVREAAARVAEARANREATRGGRLPSVTASGSATDNILSENGQLPVGVVPGLERELTLYDLGFDASWEIDLWGRQTREAEAAAAREGQALAGRDAVLQSLSAEVARAYLDWRLAEAAAANASRTAAASSRLAQLTGLRFRAGESTRIEADRASADARAIAARVAEAGGQRKSALYRIAALVGKAPEEVIPLLAPAEGIPVGPQVILTGLRSDLLRNRPDIRQAERELAAATADIGVATADLFPRFSLLGGFGVQAREPGDLLSTDSIRASFGPRFSWPIFSGETIRARIRAANARAEGAAARYEKAVVTALADSESAINRFAAADAALAEAEGRLAAERSAYRLSELRVRQGEDDRLALARAELVLRAAELELDQRRAARGTAAVTLAKALGAPSSP